MLPKITGIFRIHTKEMRYTQGGDAVLTLNMVASSKYKTKAGEQKEDTCWISGVSFSKQAELINQYFNEKDRIYIVGDLKQDNWTTQAGEKRSKHTLKIDSFEFIERKGDNQQLQNNAPQSQYSAPQTTPVNSPSQQGAIPQIDIDDDIPFAPVGMAEGGYYVHLI